VATVWLRTFGQTAEKKTLTLDAPERVIAAAKQRPRTQIPRRVIAVVTRGNLMALERIDGTFAAGETFPSAKGAPRFCFKSRPKFSKTSSTKDAPP